MTKIELMRRMCERMVEDKVDVFPNHMDGWTCITAYKKCKIGYDPDDIDGTEDINFRNACHKINSATDNFLDITLTLAHEVGHWHTRKQFSTPTEQRKYALAADEASPQDYPFIPAELAATEWGIWWILTHPDFVRWFETEWACAI